MKSALSAQVASAANRPIQTVPSQQNSTTTCGNALRRPAAKIAEDELPQLNRELPGIILTAVSALISSLTSHPRAAASVAPVAAARRTTTAEPLRTRSLMHTTVAYLSQPCRRHSTIRTYMTSHSLYKLFRPKSPASPQAPPDHESEGAILVVACLRTSCKRQHITHDRSITSTSSFHSNNLSDLSSRLCVHVTQRSSVGLALCECTAHAYTVFVALITI